MKAARFLASTAVLLWVFASGCQREVPPPPPPPPAPKALEPWSWHHLGGILVVEGEVDRPTTLTLQVRRWKEQRHCEFGPVRWEMYRPPDDEPAVLTDQSGKVLARWDFRKPWKPEPPPKAEAPKPVPPASKPAPKAAEPVKPTPKLEAPKPEEPKPMPRAEAPKPLPPQTPQIPAASRDALVRQPEPSPSMWQRVKSWFSSTPPTPPPPPSAQPSPKVPAPEAPAPKPEPAAPAPRVPDRAPSRPAPPVVPPPQPVLPPEKTPKREPAPVPSVGGLWDGAGEGMNLLRGPSGLRRVSLTFDGGSTSEVAQEVLDALRQHRVRTTFFLTGGFIHRFPDLVKRIVREGHEVGNHTMDHPHFAPRFQRDPAWTKARFQKQLLDADQAFHALVGRPMDPVWRAPYGEHTAELRKWAEELGYRHVGWSEGADTLDWATVQQRSLYRNGEAILERLRGRMARSDGDGLIVLMHLGSERPEDDRPARKLNAFMARAQQEGWSFVPVSTYLKESGRPMWDSGKRLALLKEPPR